MMAALKDCIGKNNIASFFMTDKEQNNPTFLQQKNESIKCVIPTKWNIIVPFNETEFWFWHIHNMDEPW